MQRNFPFIIFNISEPGCCLGQEWLGCSVKALCPCDVGEGSSWLWDEAAVIAHILGNLQGRTDLGLTCALQTPRTWGCSPLESGRKSPVRRGTWPLHPELWGSFSWEHFRVKPFLARHFHSHFICVSIKMLPFKRHFKYPCEEVLTAYEGWKCCSLW